MIDVPAASPSTPSVRFTLFTAPAMIRNSSTYQHRPERNRPVADRHEDAVREVLVVRREADRGRDPEQHQHLPAAVQTERPLVAELEVVVEEADRAARDGRPEHRQRRQRVVLVARNAIEAASTISRPPIVGVPCFARGAAALPRGCAGRIRSAEERDERRPAEDRDDHRHERGNEDSAISRQFSRHGLESHRREPLTSTTSPRPHAPQTARRPRRRSRPVAAVSASERADGDGTGSIPDSAPARRSRGGTRPAAGRASSMSPSTAMRRRRPRARRSARAPHASRPGSRCNSRSGARRCPAVGAPPRGTSRTRRSAAPATEGRGTPRPRAQCVCSAAGGFEE